LKDESGARRFWPIECGAIRIDDLRRDRDQLWAEARFRFEGGATWWLDNKTLVEAAAGEQQARYEGDAWDELIAAWASGRESVRVRDVLEFALEKKKDTWTQTDQNRVARILRAANWERFRIREGGVLSWTNCSQLFPVTASEWEQNNSRSFLSVPTVPSVPTYMGAHIREFNSLWGL